MFGRFPQWKQRLPRGCDRHTPQRLIDGLEVLVGDNDVQARSMKGWTFRIIDVLRSPSGQLHGVAFNPDGRLLATAGEEGVARVYPHAGSVPSLP